MLYVTFFRDSIFAKLAWTIFWIPKCNSCRKFIYRITFFALAGNAVPYTWSNKGNSFNTRLHTLSCIIFQLFKKKKILGAEPNLTHENLNGKFLLVAMMNES